LAVAGERMNRKSRLSRTNWFHWIVRAEFAGMDLAKVSPVFVYLGSFFFFWSG